ncbi:MAG: DUF3562 domain-containing protein [Steroidobacteraceae bacterium]|jgi:hypothetical protein
MKTNSDSFDRLPQSTPDAQDIEPTDAADLAQLFHVSRQVVRDVYHEQYRRLAEAARVHDYLDLLAFKNTRQALRAGHDVARSRGAAI